MIQCLVKCKICGTEFLIPEEPNLECSCSNLSIYKDDLGYTCISVYEPESLEYNIMELTMEFKDVT